MSRKLFMLKSNKVLVTGATGNTCSGLIPALQDAGVDVRAFIRDESKAQALQDMDVETVVGDLDKPETIAPAVEGVDKIYLLAWNGPTHAKHAENVIKAAQQAGNLNSVRVEQYTRS
jgi:uncharacterized protein YbjT (DUF2867 family)